jgi:hypothetical protein
MVDDFMALQERMPKSSSRMRGVVVLACFLVSDAAFLTPPVMKIHPYSGLELMTQASFCKPFQKIIALSLFFVFHRHDQVLLF